MKNFLYEFLNVEFPADLLCWDFSWLKVLRERDGIPDLRRAARFRYASVALPEVGSECFF